MTTIEFLKMVARNFLKRRCTEPGCRLWRNHVEAHSAERFA